VSFPFVEEAEFFRGLFSASQALKRLEWDADETAC
jgi:hypothetical protein